MNASPPELELTVGEFVALVNQTLDYAYPRVTITGELAHFKVSKNRWVYFDLKDNEATVRCFGTVQQLSGPLQDGMLLAVTGSPRLHPLYGFSVNVLRMRPVGEGSIKKAAALLEAQLRAEGLFDPARKRPLPYPPQSIGLITSTESAAYRDFIKVLTARWGGLQIVVTDVQVQGEAAPAQVIAALEYMNGLAEPPEVVVITRGGGSADDLQAFSTEQVTRAVAASRIPTLVAIGHEVDVSLAELAADQRASTPSNAAELLVPDRAAMLDGLRVTRLRLKQATEQAIHTAKQTVSLAHLTMYRLAEGVLRQATQQVADQRRLLAAYNPQAALQRGYALVQAAESGVLVRSGKQLQPGVAITIELHDAHVTANVKRVTIKAKTA